MNTICGGLLHRHNFVRETDLNVENDRFGKKSHLTNLLCKETRSSRSEFFSYSKFGLWERF